MLDHVYRSEARFLQHLQTQKQNIGQYAAEVGADQAMEDEITADAGVMGFLITVCNLIADYKDTAFGIKQRFYSSKTEPPAGAFAVAPDTTPPAPVNAGAIKRSRERDQYFLRQPGITQAAREALDLLGDEQAQTPVADIQPEIEARAAAMNYEAALIISNRQDADLYEILMQRAGGGDWVVLKSGRGKSINVTLTPTTPGKPEQVLLRVQLKRNDENYGQPSEPIYVTFNP